MVTAPLHGQLFVEPDSIAITLPGGVASRNKDWIRLHCEANGSGASAAGPDPPGDGTLIRLSQVSAPGSKSHMASTSPSACA